MHSEAQYRQKLNAWELHKNIPAKVMRCAARAKYDDPRREQLAYGTLEITDERLSTFQEEHPSFDPATSPTACKPACSGSKIVVF